MTKRKLKVILVIILALTLSVTSLSINAGANNSPADISFHESGDFVFVTFDRQIPNQLNPDRVRIPNGSTIYETHGAEMPTPGAPPPVGYRFGGWFSEPGGTGAVFTARTTVNASITVFAHWIRETAPEPSHNPEPSPSPEPLPSPEPSPSPTSPPNPSPSPSPSPTPPPTTASLATPEASPTHQLTSTPQGVATYHTAPPATVQSEQDSREVTAEEDDNDDDTPTLPYSDGDGTPGDSGREITDQGVPLLGGIQLFPNGQASWALINMILSVVGIVIATIYLVRYITHRRKEENEEQNNNSRFPLLLISCITSVLAAVIFFITQDLFNQMVWMDFWTIAHLVLLAVGIFAAMCVFRNQNDNGDRSQAHENAGNIELEAIKTPL